MVEIKNDEKEQVIGKYKQIWMNTINSHINGSSIASVIELPEYTVEDNLILKYVKIQTDEICKIAVQSNI